MAPTWLKRKYIACNLEQYLSTTCSQQFRAFIFDLNVGQDSNRILMKRFEVEDEDKNEINRNAIIILDESSNNSQVT